MTINAKVLILTLILQLVNLNTWLTKDECVNNFNLNGLVIYPKKPPKHWTREQWNGNVDKTDLLKDIRPIHIGL
jgi:hypothetical protein